MDLNYIKNLSNEVAEIHLYGEIGQQIQAQGFINELNYVINALQVKSVNVRINSPGGSVLDGLGIYAAITNAKVPVNTYNDGIAASISGLIFMGGKKRYMAKHAKLMIHDVAPANPDDEQGKSAKQAMAALRDSIAIVLSDNSGMSKDEIIATMSGERWIGATEALELKFIDSIVDYTPKREMAKNELMAYVNKIVKPNKISMEKVLNFLNLDATATEEKVVESIEKIKTDSANEKSALEQKIIDLQNELDALKREKEAAEAAKVEADLTASATAVVEEAINLGKFDAGKKVDLINTAKKDIEGFKNLVSSIAAKPVSIANQIGKNTPKNDGEDRSAWTIRDWEKKDVKGLQEIMNNDPERYKALYNSFYRPDKANS